MHLSEAFGQRCNSESTQVHIPVYRLNCLFFPEIIDGAVSLNILTQCFSHDFLLMQDSLFLWNLWIEWCIENNPDEVESVFEVSYLHLSIVAQ